MTRDAQHLARPSVVAALREVSSVAIVGASDDGAKPSGRTQRYLRRYGFRGAIYPINPTRDSVQGEAAYASIEDVPETPDLAVIVVPAERVEAAVVQAGQVGTKLAIIFASGYAEVEGGQARQESLRRVAAEAGVRVIGPNCVGAVAAPSLTAAFMSGLDQDRFSLVDQGVAFVSQSGAMGAFILNMAQSEGVGVGMFVSTGNEMDVTMSSLILDLAGEKSTSAILGYVEGIRDPEVFIEGLALADANNIPVCLMKVGRSDRGAAAAASHTGSLAGSDRVFDGVFAAYGVHRAESVEELLDFGRIFSGPRRPAGKRVTIVTLSGGAGALMADEADRLGLDLFPWNEPWRSRMAAGLPDFASTANPIDATGVIGISDEALRHCLDVALANPSSDVVVLVLGNLDGEEERICRTITECAARSATALVVTWVGGSGLANRLLSAQRIPTFTDPRRAMQSVAALCQRTARSDRLRQGELREPYSTSTIGHAGASDEVGVKRLLAAAGVPTVPEREAADAPAAVAAAHDLGFPVVVKLLSSDVVHKTELGVVRLSLRDGPDVDRAAREILTVAHDHGIADRRLVVQAMVTGQPELILGCSVDPVFGPVTMIGFGGVYAEILDDVAVRLSPVSVEDAMEMVNSLRGAPLLRGARNGVVVDERALGRAISGFSRLSTRLGEDVESVEVNPLTFTSDGAPVALDALLVTRSQRN